MATTRGNPGSAPKPFRFMDRLKEIGMFFQKRSPQHLTMRRLARRLKKAGISYAIMGAMAVTTQVPPFPVSDRAWPSRSP